MCSAAQRGYRGNAGAYKECCGRCISAGVQFGVASEGVHVSPSHWFSCTCAHAHTRAMDDLPPVHWTLIASILGVGCILYALTDCACRWACLKCRRDGGTPTSKHHPSRELTAQLAAIETKLAQLEREWGMDAASHVQSEAEEATHVAACDEHGSDGGGSGDDGSDDGSDNDSEDDKDELDAEAEAQVRRLKEYFTQGPRTEAYRRWRAAQTADDAATADGAAVTTTATAAAAAQHAASETFKSK